MTGTRLGPAVTLVFLMFAGWGILHAQKPFHEYRGMEYDGFPIPADWNAPFEFTVARLQYPLVFGLHGWRDGYKQWTVDYPRSDRHFLTGLRRLTRLQARSVEQVVELDGDPDIYNWPFLYVVEPGYWRLKDEQAAQLRDYLLHGGFMMTDDFHGTVEWNNFLVSMRKVFPDRGIVDIDNRDAIFHVIYDLENRYQVPGLQYLYSGSRYEFDGFEAKWRGIYDDHGRIMVAICHNMDLGDAWEHSDNPVYPERYSALAYRIAVNYVMYDLTH